MITTLCVSCNRPAPEFDRYQEIAHVILSKIAQGVTIIRLVSQGNDQQKSKIPDMAYVWAHEARDVLNEGNDLRELFAETKKAYSVHSDCAAWKVVHRRVNALLLELDFMRRDLIGHFVPGGIS